MSAYFLELILIKKNHPLTGLSDQLNIFLTKISWGGGGGSVIYHFGRICLQPVEVVITGFDLPTLIQVTLYRLTLLRTFSFC